MKRRLRWIVGTGAPWQYIPGDFPPSYTVYQQSTRWIVATCFEHLVDDLQRLVRAALGRNAEPGAVVLDARTMQSTPESGARAAYDGAKWNYAIVTAVTLASLLALWACATDRPTGWTVTAATSDGAVGPLTISQHRGKEVTKTATEPGER